MTVQSKNNAIDLLLAESLKEIAITKPIEKITIREITDRAGVIRPTFYNHFQDKYELLEWIVQNDLVGPMDPFIRRGMLKEGLTLALKNMEREKAFYIQAVHLEGQNSFHDILKRSARDLILSYMKDREYEQVQKYEWLTNEKIADFYAESISYIITTWALESMKAPESEVSEVCVYLYGHSIADVLNGQRSKQLGSR
ncbi:TetR/AcrR family transcriptional regulator C-terminal domain-containing protein [Lachnospiraceae bacterium YH-ros2228]|nr:TetR/AcrR family transcriptional regulator C-terminal domain-containing protein [Lachnospiraceae bacterium]